MENKKQSRKIFTIPAQLDGVSPLKDGGVSLRFHTQEVSPQEKVTLMESYQQYGHLLWAEDKIQKEFIPEEDTDIEGRKVKKPSVRLRAVLYLLAKQKGFTTKTEIDKYYEQQMERIINRFKEMLE